MNQVKVNIFLIEKGATSPMDPEHTKDKSFEVNINNIQNIPKCILKTKGIPCEDLTDAQLSEEITKIIKNDSNIYIRLKDSEKNFIVISKKEAKSCTIMQILSGNTMAIPIIGFNKLSLAMDTLVKMCSDDFELEL